MIHYLSTQPSNASSVKTLMDAASISYENLACLNWPDAFPYKPEVSFRMAYSDTAFLLHYLVTEHSVRAHFANDNEAVWTDSCVEFFCRFPGDTFYYNLECNAIGTVLLGCGDNRHDRKKAPKAILKKIQRWSSLGRKAFEECREKTTWELALVIPFEVFFNDSIQSMRGQSFQANFYKCGDQLSMPHYLSWQPIWTEKPDFHRPEFFGKITG